jgi:hypothetical protein
MAISRRRRHIERVNKYILTWPADDEEQIQFDGEVFWLPTINQTAETAKTRPGSHFRFESARDGHGDLIPGTVVVADRVRMIDGHRVKTFDADEFVQWVENIRHDLLDRGLMICDLESEIEEAMAEGRPLWEQSRDEWARQTLATELDRRRKWEEKGMPAPPSTSEEKVLKALEHIRNRGTEISKIATEDIVTAMSGGVVAPKVRALKGNGQQPAAPPEPLQKMSGTRLYQQAKAHGILLKKAEIEGLIEDDDDVMEAVAERIRSKTEPAAEAGA